MTCTHSSLIHDKNHIQKWVLSANERCHYYSFTRKL